MEKYTEEKARKWFLLTFKDLSLREKCPNNEFFSGLHFPVVSPGTGKYRPEKTQYLDTFQAVSDFSKTDLPRNLFFYKLTNKKIKKFHFFFTSVGMIACGIVFSPV